MKRSELEKPGLTKEQIDAVTAVNGNDIDDAKQDDASKDAQIATLLGRTGAVVALLATRMLLWLGLRS